MYTVQWKECVIMQQQQQQQQQKGIWLPLIASVGVGAATFYSMRNGKGMGQTIQQMIPFVAGMKNNNSSQKSNEQTSTQNNQMLQ